MNDAKSIRGFQFTPTGIAGIFKTNRLKVPPYQREYSWTKDEVGTLYNDYSRAKNDNSDYFLGTIVTIKGNRNEPLEIVDGQQRLTTTALLIASIRERKPVGGSCAAPAFRSGQGRSAQAAICSGEMVSVEILVGDCRELMRGAGPFDMIVADPPYGDTSLKWDRRVSGWLEVAAASLKPAGSLWLFGSMRLLMAIGPDVAAAGLIYCQDIVWEKQNGTGFHADRLKRVHEHVVQFRRADYKWADVFNDVPRTAGGTKKTVRRKERPPHTGAIQGSQYVSEDGGPRIVRSVIAMRNCHGFAIHETEKPIGLADMLIRMSAPEGGLVGDFFAGSGVFAEACRASGRRYVGCDTDGEMVARARERISTALAF